AHFLLESLKVERKDYKGVGKIRPLNLGNFIPLLTAVLKIRHGRAGCSVPAPVCVRRGQGMEHGLRG
ncbi:MAG: hypothetical protein WA144_12710, partial [Candidatus Methanoperedens sp.]